MDELKIEVELRIEPDGSVIFADLASDMLAVREALLADPGEPLACEVPQRNKETQE